MLQLLIITAAVLAPGDLVLSELMYDPDGATLGDDDDMEWIELYNASGETQSLHGMTLEDPNNMLILQGYLLGPGEFAVVAANAEEFEAVYGEGVPLVGWSGSWTKMSNSGDIIVLRDAEGVLMDSVAYSDEWGTPEGADSSPADGDGSSLEKIDLTGGSGRENWWPSIDWANPAAGGDADPVCWGTPGAPNSVSDR